MRNSKSAQPHSPSPATQRCPSVLQTQGCLGLLALRSLPEGKEVTLGRDESIRGLQISHISHSKILKAFDQAITLRAEAGVAMKPTL